MSVKPIRTLRRYLQVLTEKNKLHTKCTTSIILTTGCDTPYYRKDDGLIACAVFLKGTFDFPQAEEKCNEIGGRLPQIQGSDENNLIAKFKVRKLFF